MKTLSIKLSVSLLTLLSTSSCFAAPILNSENAANHTTFISTIEKSNCKKVGQQLSITLDKRARSIESSLAQLVSKANR